MINYFVSQSFVSEDCALVLAKRIIKRGHFFLVLSL